MIVRIALELLKPLPMTCLAGLGEVASKLSPVSPAVKLLKPVPLGGDVLAVLLSRTISV